MADVFISYRRSDAGGHAGRLFDRLRLWFDADALFYDLDGIDSGDVFSERLEDAVKGAKVVLVLIGPDWLAEINRRATRSAVDFVRVEVELALRLHGANGTPKVIPVLLGGAKPPSLPELHETLRGSLERLPALDVHEFHGKNEDWDQQFVRLRELIARVPGIPAPRFRPPAGTPKPFRITDHTLSPHFRDPTGALPRVRDALLGRGDAATIVAVALYGMGGVGKTQLALKYSLEYRDSYAGVWWFRAEAENTLQLDARDACIEAGAPIPDGELPTAAFKRWLGRQEQPWLLVFDNAERAEAVRPHLPQSGPHHVLITSRDPAWGGVAKPVELAVWSDKEGAGFLAARLPAAGRGHLERLSRALGGLQLALEQAAAFLEETGGAVADYCEGIQGVDTAALVLDEGRASTGYERSVLATLSLAFPRLGAAAQQLLRICAFFSAEPIPERYFREGADHLPEDLAGAARQGLVWDRTVGELRRFGIVDRLEITPLDRIPGQPDERMEKALVLHRLTLEVARHALSVPAEDGPRAQKLLRACCPRETAHPKEWARFAALLPHLLSLDRWSAQAWLDRRAHSWMLDRVGGYLRDGKTLYKDSERMFRRALELDRADLDEDHRDTLVTMNNLAGTLWAQGDLASARALHEQVLSIQRRVLGEEHPDTLISMNNLAETLRAQGDLAGARALHEQVLSIQRRVLGEEHPDTLVSMNNLALTLRAQGDHAGARALHEQVLSVRRRVQGEWHPDTQTSMNNLAATLWAQGDRAGARALQEQVLSIQRRLLGEQHPDTLRSMNNLAITLWVQGARGDAVALMASAAEGWLSRLGAEHPHTQASVNALAAMRAARDAK